MKTWSCGYCKCGSAALVSDSSEAEGKATDMDYYWQCADNECKNKPVHLPDQNYPEWHTFDLIENGTQVYQYELFDHISHSLKKDGIFYRIAIKADNEKDALMIVKKEANKVANEWLKKDPETILQSPFILYKRVGHVSGWIPEEKET